MYNVLISAYDNPIVCNNPIMDTAYEWDWDCNIFLI